MSAFMVSHDCIHRVVLAMRAFHSGYAEEDRDLLGMALIELNRLAIKARYGDRPEVEPYQYVEPGNGDPIQIFKSLRCFVYQCSEGNVPDQQLYIHAAATRDNIGETLGYDGNHWSNPRNEAAYQDAEWG